jgi:ATP-binding cassette, subfamily F, member 2
MGKTIGGGTYLMTYEIKSNLCCIYAAAIDEVTDQIEELYACAVQRAVTGVLSSHPDSRDVHIDSLSITFHGAELLVDTRLELNNGRRYGLIGLNGCGN